MGIFGKIKKVKNYLGGGGASLSISTDELILDGNKPLKFNIVCEVKDADLEIRKAYLNVKALEKVVVQNVERAQKKENEVETKREDVNGSHQTFCEKVIIVGQQVLKANQTYRWEAELQLPQDVNGTYKGHNAFHEWSAYAGLDMPGNDPDSNWITFTVKK